MQAPSPGAQLVAEGARSDSTGAPGFYNDGDGRLVATAHGVAYRRESGP